MNELIINSYNIVLFLLWKMTNIYTSYLSILHLMFPSTLSLIHYNQLCHLDATLNSDFKIQTSIINCRFIIPYNFPFEFRVLVVLYSRVYNASTNLIIYFKWSNNDELFSFNSSLKRSLKHDK
jgi:hypothetical protein